MQVDSVKNSTKTPSLVFKASPQERLFVSLNDNDIRNLAWKKASYDVNDKKHRAIDNALYYSLPVAGGISAAVRKYSPEYISKVGSHNLRAARLADFGKSFAGWALAITALDILWSSKDYIAKKVDFIKENPIMSSIATFVAGFGVLALVNRAGSKALAKMLDKVDYEKALPYLRKVRNALNDSKILNKTSEFLKKVPSPIKDIGKGTAELAPLIVIGTQIGHLFGHQKVKAEVAAKNYDEFKQAQVNIKEFIADEEIDRNLR